MKTETKTITDEVYRRFISSAQSSDYRRVLEGYGLDMLAFNTLSGRDNLVFHSEHGHLRGLGQIHHLNWDSEFFGVDTARIENLLFSQDSKAPFEIRANLIGQIVERADKGNAKFLSCRITAEDTLLAQALEEQGFRLCDILNVYVKTLKRIDKIIPDRREEAFRVLDHCLGGMKWGRVYQDPNIEKSKAREFYQQISVSMLSKDCHVTIARENGLGVGLAIGVLDPKVSEFMDKPYGVLWLIAIAPEFHGRGVGKKLLKKFIKEVSGLYDFLEIGTQVSNVGANKMYLSVGCNLLTQALTFHRWRINT